MRPLIQTLPVALTVLAGCSGDEGPCLSAEEPCVYEHEFPAITLAPGEEIDELCQSWTLDNPQEMWVTSIGMDNDGGYHHSNWFFVPDDAYQIPDGTWDCDANEFDELNAAILGGYFFAQTTQSTDEVHRFPGGSAVRIPPYSRIIGSTHLLNASDQELPTRMGMHVETVPTSDVDVKLTPARIEYRDLELDPMARSEFTAECHIGPEYQEVMASPWRFSLYFVLPHYHELGTHFQIEILGGPRDGEVLYRHDGYGGETFGHAFDPPIDFAAAEATGIRFTCGFDNPRSEVVNWGIGDQEMCVTAILADTDMAFEGDVPEGAGEEIGITGDGVHQHTGPCDILGIPWDHDKPGGPPR